MTGESLEPGKLTWVVPIATARRLAEDPTATGADTKGARLTGRVIDIREANAVAIVITAAT